MSQLGTLFAITREEVDALMALPEEDRVEHMYENIMETLFDTPRACELDKSWLGIHRVLTGPGELDSPYDVDEKAGSEPLRFGVCGGALLCPTDAHVLTLTTPEQAGAFAAAVAGWDEAAFNEAYDRDAARTMEGRFGEEYRGFCFEYFKELRDLHARAAAA
ncbi:MAG: DUF1877 family protein, partial [Rhodospirillales bacterium]|nr:DUF1877 family protein [Rhodospirillales bacterium]